MFVPPYVVDRLGMKKLMLSAALMLPIALLLPPHAQGALFEKNRVLSAAEAALLTPPPADPGPLVESMRWQVLQAANRERASVGLPALTGDPVLDQAAARYSRKMRDWKFFDHVAPDGEGLDQRLPEGEKWRYDGLGENLWSGQGALNWQAPILSAEVAANWVESPGHRENLFDPTFTTAGVGAAMVGDQLYVTMLYATPVADMAAARLQRDFGQAPADLGGFDRALEQAILRTLNSERARRGVGALGAEATLASIADQNAQQGLWSGTPSRGVLDQVFAADPNRSGRLAAGFQRAGSGVIWQAETAAQGVVERWLNGSTASDLLDGAFSQAGVGVATDGTALMVTIILGENRRVY